MQMNSFCHLNDTFYANLFKWVSILSFEKKIIKILLFCVEFLNNEMWSGETAVVSIFCRTFARHRRQCLGFVTRRSDRVDSAGRISVSQVTDCNVKRALSTGQSAAVRYAKRPIRCLSWCIFRSRRNCSSQSRHFLRPTMRAPSCASETKRNWTIKTNEKRHIFFFLKNSGAR